jgi:hypothetical protein
VPLVTRTVALIDWLPVELQVAPVMLPLPLLLLLLLLQDCLQPLHQAPSPSYPLLHHHCHSGPAADHP